MAPRNGFKRVSLSEEPLFMTPAQSSHVKHEESATPSLKRIKLDPVTSSSSPTPAPPARQLSKNAKDKVAKVEAIMRGSLWPQLERPTPQECQEVHDLLSEVHGKPSRPARLVDRENAPAGCGEVPNVLDALVRTILSQNTTSANSTAAKQALDLKYGRANYRAVLNGTVTELAETIKTGGLQGTKSKCIHGLLRVLDEREGGKGSLDMDYLHSMDPWEAMKEMVSLGGVGLKTAACVVLFCLQKPCFAVDTHVHRITTTLGWANPGSPDDVFHHLENRIPDDLKYGLHSLLVRHGRGCVKCSADGKTSMDFVDRCPIEHLVKKSVWKGKGKGKGTGRVTGSKMVKTEDNVVKMQIEEEEPGVKVKEETATPPRRAKTNIAQRNTTVVVEIPAGRRSSTRRTTVKIEDDSLPLTSRAGPSTRKIRGEASFDRDEAEMGGAMHGLDG
ncbi:DNA glycosylase [Meredithblackwellia eburnea MCA 4105]